MKAQVRSHVSRRLLALALPGLPNAFSNLNASSSSPNSEVQEYRNLVHHYSAPFDAGSRCTTEFRYFDCDPNLEPRRPALATQG
ncbi:hypothetical protein EDB81DRAFT_777417 [Dactylonectria macrodidyma]|uniref:Uncharacterized protein n=1 Tax=Dactylonectria macrodidyma TaxID=307937 RepID=A0A9P9FQP9_9HYPO|nr:hypothetical protein EDB81DRAFT_777417 [Dactylonectria macrodidyma]